MILLENINKFCAKEGISTKEFERRCKLANSSVGKWKRGIATPSFRTLEKISKATNIPIEEWLRSDEA